MQQEIFADGISAIHITGNLVRIDFVTVQPQLASDNGQPVMDVSSRIIMPLEGFVRSLTVHEDIVNQLMAAGVITRTPPEELGTM
ncbi:hypothetical protein [Anaeroselena agilis]|uniref:Uncharacterized protein n=1 Tax=Anaeroselena agilis TaxID=3063788 RepID=A0ABU3P0Z5_9FIRM|nr:hypothetical protein [Selenomonadales bacterium 4137-cl]